MGHFIERCQHSSQHRGVGFWYNSRISRKRDSLFDIVPDIGRLVRPNFQCLEYRPEAQIGRIPLAQRVREAEAGVRDPTPPQLTATGKTPDGDAHVASARREGRSPLRPIHDFGEGSEPLFFSAQGGSSR